MILLRNITLKKRSIELKLIKLRGIDPENMDEEQLRAYYAMHGMEQGEEEGEEYIEEGDEEYNDEDQEQMQSQDALNI